MNDKELIKKLKKEYRDRESKFRNEVNEILQPKKAEFIVTGLFNGESILDFDYPVYAGYFYVAEYTDGTYKVKLSDVSGNVSRLIACLNNLIYHSDVPTIKAIRNCNLAARNFYN